MSLFLNLVSVSKAVEQVRSIAIRCGDESVPLSAALHRVLAQDLPADVDIPGFTRSVVDGFAVRAADTTGSGESIPSILAFRGRIAMGSASAMSVKPGECIYVPTGGVLPEGADAVVMIEHASSSGRRCWSEDLWHTGRMFSSSTRILPGGMLCVRWATDFPHGISACLQQPDAHGFLSSGCRRWESFQPGMNLSRSVKNHCLGRSGTSTRMWLHHSYRNRDVSRSSSGLSGMTGMHSVKPSTGPKRNVMLS